MKTMPTLLTMLVSLAAVLAAPSLCAQTAPRNGGAATAPAPVSAPQDESKSDAESPEFKKIAERERLEREKNQRQSDRRARMDRLKRLGSFN